MKIKEEAQNPNKSGITYPHVTTWDVIKEYWKLTKPYRFIVFCIVFGVIVSNVAGAVIIPIYYKNFFDTLNTVSAVGKDITPLIYIVFWILFINFFNWIGWRAAWFLTNYLEGHVTKDALEKSFKHLIEHSHFFFSNNFSGSLVQKINRFSRSFGMIFESVAYDLFSLIIKILGAGIVLYFLQPIIAYVLGVWIVVFLSVSFLITRIKLKYDIRAAEMHSKLSGALSDSISNHNSVQFFSGYRYESQRINDINYPFMKLNIFRWNFGSLLDAVQALLSIVIEFFIFYYGIKYWQMGLVSLGTFVLVQAYILNIGHSMWGFSRVVRDIYQGVADAKEMVEILHLPHEIEDIDDAKELSVDRSIIEFKDVTFGFSENRPVFSNLNLFIKPGEKVAIIGSSGAGKSTLVKLLLRLHDIKNGEILIDGQNIAKVTQESLRQSISLVPQDPALFHRTLMENIRYGKRSATDEEVLKASHLAHADIFIQDFPYKYETYVGERGVKLSGGERQRVSIARALLKNAPILVLDEATSSLDSHSESLIQDALNTLMKGKTTIVIAHRLSTICKMDRIIVLGKSGVVEEGTHDELLKMENGVYAHLWNLQAGGFSDKSIEELLEV